MAIEIVSFPMIVMVIFHSFLCKRLPEGKMDNKGYPKINFGNLHICSPANSWSFHGIEAWPCIHSFQILREFQPVAAHVSLVRPQLVKPNYFQSFWDSTNYFCTIWLWLT